VQMTGGRITQMPDGSRLLYSIPTMQGSSGSPVVDDRGNLVGVNFAKLNGTDNFNFGIPLQKVRRFVKE
jgi:S1-C subfamily serine protease